MRARLRDVPTHLAHVIGAAPHARRSPASECPDVTRAPARGAAARDTTSLDPKENIMNSGRIILATVVALGLVAGAAWAGPVSNDAAKSTPTAATPMTHVTAKAPAHSKLAAKSAAMPRVDLNTATREELSKLPGMNEATADKIIAARPFKSRGELRSKGLVSGVEYAKLREHVIAKSTTVAASSK
jgi:competence protein ComEA